MKQGPNRKVLHRIGGERGHLYKLSCGHHVQLKDPLTEWPCHHCKREANRAASLAAPLAKEPAPTSEAAIDLVDAICGPDPDGRYLDIVAAVLAASRANRAERSRPANPSRASQARRC